MMRVIRAVVAVAFAVTLVAFIWVFGSQKLEEDKTIPTITVDSEVLEVDLDVDDEKLLQGVTAYDAKDGDLTEKVIVQSVSKFLSKGTCKVNYAVCDSDNHVAFASRKIHYTKYTSPVFYMNDDLCFSVYDSINLSTIIGVKDCIDGDISGKLQLTSEDFDSSVGVYSVTASATNSKGDSVSLEVPLIVENRSETAPKITLKSYLIYTKVGATVDFKSYIKNVEVFNTNVSETTTRRASSSSNETTTSPYINQVRVESMADLTKTGTYTVHYRLTDAAGNEGHTVLIVIVED